MPACPPACRCRRRCGDEGGGEIPPVRRGALGAPPAAHWRWLRYLQKCSTPQAPSARRPRRTRRIRMGRDAGQERVALWCVWQGRRARAGRSSSSPTTCASSSRPSPSARSLLPFPHPLPGDGRVSRERGRRVRRTGAGCTRPGQPETAGQQPRAPGRRPAARAARRVSPPCFCDCRTAPPAVRETAGAAEPVGPCVAGTPSPPVVVWLTGLGGQAALLREILPAYYQHVKQHPVPPRPAPPGRAAGCT